MSQKWIDHTQEMSAFLAAFLVTYAMLRWVWHLYEYTWLVAFYASTIMLRLNKIEQAAKAAK